MLDLLHFVVYLESDWLYLDLFLVYSISMCYEMKTIYKVSNPKDIWACSRQLT